ncbi:MAG: tryptophan synthase subunit alpha [Nitrospirota bacterium]|nr:tryptophan synthase subunit alpha [Nitrospirota bacterium]
MNRIDQVFKQIKRENRKALIPYIMAGDPDLGSTKDLVLDLESAGADIIELGVPFSDPLADGPTIQRAAERSLQQGTTLRKVLALVKEIRRHTRIPLVLMTYYNPVFRFGIERFAEEAVRAGVDGTIIPDLIPDEADDFIRAAKQHGLDTVFLLAPTSTPDRIRKVTKAATGFIYYVSITGITGSKLSMSSAMKNTLEAVKKSSNKPVAVGFGISNPAEASAAAKLADGVIIGSAIVKMIAQGKSVNSFVKNIRKAI